MSERLPILGRTYRYRYGYPWRWALPAEVAWRLEHLRLGVVARRAYGWRKAAERRAYEAKVAEMHRAEGKRCKLCGARCGDCGCRLGGCFDPSSRKRRRLA